MESSRHQEGISAHFASLHHLHPSSSSSYADLQLTEDTEANLIFQNTNLLYRVPELTTLEPILYFIHSNEEAIRRCIKLSKPAALYGLSFVHVLRHACLLTS